MTKVRVAPSLGELERSFESAWGLETYNPVTDINEETVFVGLYGLPDFYTVWKHQGQKYVWWCGTDITNFVNGYWLDTVGSIRLSPKSIATWLNANCEHWVENEVEQLALKKAGIDSQVCPSFLGNINDYKISYKWSNNPKIYTSVSGDDFELYRWNEIPSLAIKYPDIEFHLYGNTKQFPIVIPSDLMPLENIFIHGRVSKEQMNNEIKEMQGALRLTRMDGFSEILAKSVLWGQWPVSVINYPFMLKVSEIKLLKDIQEANIEGRDYYRKILNKYPWVK